MKSTVPIWARTAGSSTRLRQQVDGGRQGPGEVHRRLPAGPGQPVGDDAEVRRRVADGRRHLDPQRGERVAAARAGGADEDRRGQAQLGDRLALALVVGAERGGHGGDEQHVAAAPEARRAARRAPGTDSTSKRVPIEPDGVSVDSAPPGTTSWRETELTIPTPRCTPRTTVSTGSRLRATPMPAATGRANVVRSTVIVTVPGRRSAIEHGRRRRLGGRRVGAVAAAAGDRCAAATSTASALDAGSGPSSRSFISSTPPTPSVSTWSARRYSAARPPSRPSMTVRSHGERDVSNWVASTSPTRSRTWRRSPGAGMASSAHVVPGVERRVAGPARVGCASGSGRRAATPAGAPPGRRWPGDRRARRDRAGRRG